MDVPMKPKPIFYHPEGLLNLWRVARRNPHALSVNAIKCNHMHSIVFGENAGNIIIESSLYRWVAGGVFELRPSISEYFYIASTRIGMRGVDTSMLPPSLIVGLQVYIRIRSMQKRKEHERR
jgi:hypothetical protein